MRHFIVFAIFCLISPNVQAQGNFQEKNYLSIIDNFNTLKLDTIWEYCPNVDTAQCVWQSINSITLENTNGTPSQWNGIGWFRKAFTIPDSLKNKPLYFQIAHWGASEIYLDDVKVVTYGKISDKSALEITYLPKDPITFIADNRPVHYLTVHYSNHRQFLPGVPAKLKGFSLGISSLISSSSQKYFTNARFMVSISFTLAFSIFFFFVYIFYPRRLASLMAAIWLLHFSIIFIGTFLESFITDGELSRMTTLVWASCVATINGSVLLFYYALYYGKLPKRSRIVVLIMVVLIVLIWTVPVIINFIGLFNMLYYIEIFRILYLGYRKDRNNFWILAIGQPLSLFLFMLAIANAFGVFSDIEISAAQTFFSILSDLCLPIMLSLQLAWEYGSSNRLLQKQVTQLKILSEDNLLKEQEKQHILATQNETLEKQVTERTTELNKSLTDLKATQNQLIQSEKLASLGELTAGIAHEIQNPLNFVNNFSELSVDLVKDLKEEIEKPSQDKEYIGELFDDLSQNQEKINHHGKRASSIVKGMLEHSRSSTGVKELTDINKLADEYLRLSYHGLRAKDNSFNADFKTDFEGNLPKIEVIPQDIGRVLLNLINNAFYAVNQRNTVVETGHALSLPKYQPTVSVSTQQIDNQIIIKVKDNGLGMPESVRAKVFQPFFTTKPTGQGTGLGLSLAYDIVTKGHGGTLDMESTERVGTEFIITLPLKNKEL